MTTYATDVYSGTGSQVEFAVTFDFIQRDHVKVFRVDKADGAEVELTQTDTNPTGDEYQWQSNILIEVGTAPTTEQTLKIQRDTPEDQQIIQWNDGSYIVADDLNTSDLQWLYGLQELEDKFGLLSTTAIKYLGAIDLTVDDAPASPAGGDFYINTGTGSVLASWTGIGGDAVVGSEQVIYNSVSSEWQIFAVPSSQQGVLQVTGTSPIEVDNTNTQRPEVSITPATTTAAGSMSAADKTKLDGVEAGAEANVNADWNATTGDAEILNKPAIPAAQVNSDWDATSGVAEILNKPAIIPEAPSDGKTYGRKDAAWSEVEPGGVTQIVAGDNVTISPSGGTGVVTVNSTGGGGGGVPEAPIDGNQYARQDAGWSVVTGGGGGGGGTTKADIYGTAKAWGKVARDGSLTAGLNIASSGPNGTGKYDVVFTTPMPNANYAITFGFDETSGNGVAIKATNQTANGFSVTILDNPAGGSVVNSAFNFALYDNEPAEIIVGSGTVTNTNLYGTAKAWADVEADGTLNNGMNIASVSVNSANLFVYDVVFITPMPDNAYAVNVTVNDSNGGFAYTRNLTPTGFQYVTRDNNGTGAARDADFSVFDQEPAEVALTTFGDVINYGGASAWGYVTSASGLVNGLNIASVTPISTGVYDVVFTTPMPNADYAITGASTTSAGAFRVVSFGFRTANGFRANVFNSNNAASGEAFSFAVHSSNALPPKGGTGTDSWATCQADGTIDASFNVASVTSTSTGVYDVLFTTPMPSGSYAITGSVTRDPGENSSRSFNIITQSASGFTCQIKANTSVVENPFSFTVNATNAQLPNTVTQEQIESAINNPGASAWGDVTEEGTLTSGLNIASVVRNPPTGASYEVTFSTPMPDVNYSIVGTALDLAGQGREFNYLDKTATGFTVTLRRPSSGGGSPGDFSFTVHATNALPPKGGTGTDSWASVQADGTIDASFNVASVTRTGTGQYNVVFTTPMPTANYSVIAIPDVRTTGVIRPVNKTTTGFTVDSVYSGGSGYIYQDTTFNFAVNATNATLPNTVTQEQIEAAINNPGASAWGNVLSNGTLANGLNIASVTKTETGKYDVVFASPLPDQNYSVVASNNGGEAVYVNAYTLTTQGFSIACYTYAPTLKDIDFSFTVFATNALPPKGGTGTDAWASVAADGTLGSSFNIASIEKTGTGGYKATFTTPMPTADYAVTGSTIVPSAGQVFTFVAYNKTTTSFQWVTNQDTGSTNPYADCAASFQVNATNATLPATLTQDMLVMKATPELTGTLTSTSGAEFAGDISADNVIFTLDPEHPEKVLDIKARLQNTQAVLLRIKAALIQPDATANELRNRLLEALDILVDDDE